MSTPPRRQRATVACLSCSTRKKRCDGGRPCVSCTAAGQSCVYDETGRKRKRGLLPGYVKVLESLYGQIFTNVANSEDAVLQLFETLRLGQDFEDAEHEDNTNALSERWKQSRVCAVIEQKLSEGDYTGSRRSNSRPVYTLFALPGGGPVPEANRLSASDDVGSGAESSRASTVQTAVTSAAQLSQALSVRPAWEKISIVASSGISLMLPSNTYELVDIFFTFTACWLPIIDRRSVFKTIDLYVQGESLVLEPAQERDQHALLWAVITYASFQKQSAVQDQRQHLRDEDDLTLDQLMQTTSAVVELGSTKTNASMIQAQVLISLVYCGRAEYVKAWRGIGNAIAALKSSHSVDAAALAATRAGCFVVDTLLATHTRLQAHFRGEKIGYFAPEEVQEYEPWSNHTNLRPDEPVRSHNQPQRLFSTFSSLVELLSIVSVFIGDGSVETAQQSLTIWYNDFSRRHRQAFGEGSAQDVPWTPQMLNVMIIYNYVGASINGIFDTHGDIHVAKHPLTEIRRLHSAWQKNFGLSSTPATMTLFLETISTNDIQGMFIGSRGRWLGETAEPTSRQTADVMSRDETTPRTQRMELDEQPTQFLPVSAQANEARIVTARTQLGHSLTEAAPSTDGLYHIPFASPLQTDTSTAFGHYGTMQQSSHMPSFVNNQVGQWDVSSMPGTSQIDTEDLAFATFMDDFIYNLDSRQELDGQYLSNLGYVDGFENIYNQPQ